MRKNWPRRKKNIPESLNPHKRNNAHLTFPFLDEIVHHPVILDAVEDLIGENILAWGSVLFVKEPHSARSCDLASRLHLHGVGSA